MTLQEVRERLRSIREAEPDAEVAHIIEDALYLDVLTAIASGQFDDATCRALAAEAIKSRAFGHKRWAA